MPQRRCMCSPTLGSPQCYVLTLGVSTQRTIKNQRNAVLRNRAASLSISTHKEIIRCSSKQKGTEYLRLRKTGIKKVPYWRLPLIRFPF